MAIAAQRRETFEVPVGPLTCNDLDRLPDPEESGLRFELLDGDLLMTPSPVLRHQIAVTKLIVLLHNAIPPGWMVIAAPMDWKISDFTALQPDILIIEREIREGRYEGVPLLAVEVLSPSTRHRDIGSKRRAYEDGGLPHYWVVDPDEPSLTVFRLINGRLVEQMKVTGEAPYAAVEPVSARVAAADLIRP